MTVVMNSNNLISIKNSKKGINRERNQDDYLILNGQNSDLFIIFDGVSSNPNSYQLIRLFKNVLIKKWKLNDYDELSGLFYTTHNEILAESISGSSTLCALHMSHSEKKASFLSIGDSRIYAFTNRYLEKITVDDSLSDRRNVITRYLGQESLDKLDFEFLSTNYKTNYLLCTDGFYSLMENNLKEYFIAFNFKKEINIRKKLLLLQRRMNSDDSTFLIVRHEI